MGNNTSYFSEYNDYNEIQFIKSMKLNNPTVTIGMTKLGETIHLNNRYYKLYNTSYIGNNKIEYEFDNYIYLTVQKSNQIKNYIHVLNYSLCYDRTLELGSIMRYQLLDCTNFDKMLDLQL
jgi:hypothetical protein